MIKKSIFPGTLIVGLLVLTGLISFSSYSQADNSSQQSPALTKVESKYVCMVTNQEFAREQIPVELDGKTYYGCCEMCKAKIKNNPQSREATDPVSGNKVDKADAVIGAAPNGKVFYFENEENMENFAISSAN